MLTTVTPLGSIIDGVGMDKSIYLWISVVGNVVDEATYERLRGQSA